MPNEAKDELAKAIALKIINWQSRLARLLNNWANRFSKRQQQRLLAVFCFLSGAGLILCLLVPYGKIAMNNSGKNYQPTHIGLPSERPRPAQLKSTDTLTLKK